MTEDELYTEDGKLTNTGLRVWMDDEGGAVSLIRHGTSGTVFEDPETELLWEELTRIVDEIFDPVLDQLYKRID